MTCIVGVSEQGKVYLGADSASVSDWDIRITKLQKVFHKGQVVIGYTGSFRMGQLLQHRLIVPPCVDAKPLPYMVNVFVEAVRQCFRDGGYTKIDNNQEEGGHFLVGYRGVLYYVGGDFQVNSYQDGIAAVGCGADYALAALHVLPGLPPRERIQRALETAAYFSNGVVGPFYQVEV